MAQESPCCRWRGLQHPPFYSWTRADQRDPALFCALGRTALTAPTSPRRLAVPLTPEIPSLRLMGLWPQAHLPLSSSIVGSLAGAWGRAAAPHRPPFPCGNFPVWSPPPRAASLNALKSGIFPIQMDYGAEISKQGQPLQDHGLLKSKFYILYPPYFAPQFFTTSTVRSVDIIGKL